RVFTLRNACKYMRAHGAHINFWSGTYMDGDQPTFPLDGGQTYLLTKPRSMSPVTMEKCFFPCTPRRLVDDNLELDMFMRGCRISTAADGRSVYDEEED